MLTSNNLPELDNLVKTDFTALYNILFELKTKVEQLEKKVKDLENESSN